ncbi:MAG: 50S ribosomal protein L20 [Planctomycetota bacterium]|jgi:large subunit ribosomal protein L20
MRATNGVARHKRKKRIMKQVKGFYGRRHLLLRTAIESLEKSWQYSYQGRKRRKRDFRRLWITRINGACRPLGIKYSRLICGLKHANIELDRKQLSELAIHDPSGFAAVVDKAKAALAAAA